MGPQGRYKSFTSLMILLVLGGCTTDDHATGVIEKKYAASGPHSVTVARTTPPCDHRGNQCDLYYPTDLAAGVPIITWATGPAVSLTRPITFSNTWRPGAS